MTRRRFIELTALALAPLLTAAAPQTSSGADDALRKFQHAIDEYVSLRQQLDARLPPLAVSSDVREIQRAVDARAAAIRNARVTAHMGELFNPVVSDLFRARIRGTLAARRGSSAALLHEMSRDSGHRQSAVVNGRFSWTSAAATPPCVLAVLPALPPELQYRFVGPDLALVDIDAALVVDVLRDTLDTSAHTTP